MGVTIEGSPVGGGLIVGVCPFWLLVGATGLAVVSLNHETRLWTALAGRLSDRVTGPKAVGTGSVGGPSRGLAVIKLAVAASKSVDRCIMYRSYQLGSGREVRCSAAVEDRADRA